MSETTIELQYPIERANGETVTALTLRRPKLRDLKEMDRHQGNVAKSAALIGRLAALTPSEMEQLDGADFQALDAVAMGFLASAPTTGAS